MNPMRSMKRANTATARIEAEEVEGANDTRFVPFCIVLFLGVDATSSANRLLLRVVTPIIADLSRTFEDQRDLDLLILTSKTHGHG